VRLLELPAQLGDGPTQEFQLGALFVAQLDAPIPRLIGLSHGRCFAVPRPAPLNDLPSARVDPVRKRDAIQVVREGTDWARPCQAAPRPSSPLIEARYGVSGPRQRAASCIAT
jgi:hypothetical protein